MLPHWLAIIILGIIEGITEFLPVSSTGHMLIAEKLFKLHESDLFIVVIQAGAVLAVLPLFPDRISQLFHGLHRPEVRNYWVKLTTAFVITGIGGLILEKRHFKLPEEALPIGWALLIGGVLFVAVEWWLGRSGRGDAAEITWTIAVVVGLGQLIAAVFPGSSRSGTTILLMLMLGLARPAATEFSFLVGIPTMLAASGWKIFKALRHPEAGAPPEDWTMVGLGFVVAALVSFVVVKWLLGYVRTHTFTAFGWYRIAAGLLILLFLR